MQINLEVLIVMLRTIRERINFTPRGAVMAALVVIGLILATSMITYATFAHDISNRERLMNRGQTGIVIKDRNGEVIYSYGRLSSEPEVKLDQVSDHFEHAVLASEDQNFYNHDGYSLRGIMGALYANIRNKDATRYGGSTITQQLVKNKLLTNEKTFFRKYQEVVMAVAVEQRYSKQEIMEMYLNSVYFGEGAFGVSAAAKTYFNKSAQDLSLAESSLLVGLLPAPTAYSPISGDPKAAKTQQARVLARMESNGYIKSAENKTAAKLQLTYTQGITAAKAYPHAQHFVTMVLDEINTKYGAENVTRAGYEVTTTLDLSSQKQAEEKLRTRISQIQHLGATNASLVAIDPKNGEIRALVGSVDWNNAQFGKVNMAITPRQPGSSFKPIYYTEALKQKLITAATVVHDEEKSYGDWHPSNYDFRYRGDITVRNALAQSLNMPAIEVMEKLSPETASATAKRMQIGGVDEPQKYGLSLALGTAEVKVLDMTNAYAALANGGEQYDATKVLSIKDKSNRRVFNAAKKSARQVTSPEASFLMSSILSDNEARAPTFGSMLNIAGRPVAVKTGTTNDSKDAWTIGYTPNLSVGVWVGNNQHKPMAGLGGSSSAGAIWKGTMQALAGKQPVESFIQAPGIVQFEVCGIPGLNTSKKSDAQKEYFIKGTEPEEACDSKNEPKEVKNDGEQRRREENNRSENRRSQGNGQNTEPANDEDPAELPVEEVQPNPAPEEPIPPIEPPF